MSTTDLFTGTAQSDGEGITFGDLNDSPRFAVARLFDQILENQIGDLSLTGANDPAFSGARGTNAPNHLAYALHGGSAYLRQGSATNKLQIAPGVLLQKIANQTGLEATLLPYSFVGTEEVAIGAGSGTNPRVDLVQMALTWVAADSQSRDFQDAVTGAYSTTVTNKKRRVQCTLSVKSGAAAASPIVPDPDAGYVAVATILVGTSYATTTSLTFGLDTAGAVAVVYDQRMPINLDPRFMTAEAATIATAWTRAANPIHVDTNSVTNELFWRFSPGDACSRLVGLELRKDANAWGTTGITIQSTDYSTFPILNTLPATTVAQQYLVPYYSIDAGHTPAAGPTMIASTTNKIGAPVWSSGYRCAVPIVASSVREPLLDIKSGLASSSIWFGKFVWAR